jgi:hypothetical protein
MIMMVMATQMRMRMIMSQKAVQFKTAMMRIMMMRIKIKEIQKILHRIKLQDLEEYPNLLQSNHYLNITFLLKDTKILNMPLLQHGYLQLQ